VVILAQVKGVKLFPVVKIGTGYTGGKRFPVLVGIHVTGGLKSFCGNIDAGNGGGG
jgi:hypothetical protein